VTQRQVSPGKYQDSTRAATKTMDKVRGLAESLRCLYASTGKKTGGKGTCSSGRVASQYRTMKSNNNKKGVFTIYRWNPPKCGSAREVG